MPQQQQFDVNAARQSGATDDQILSYLAQRSPGFDAQGALRESSKPEVINYLSTHASAPTGMQSTSTAPEQPGFFRRLGESLGVPTSGEELESALTPVTVKGVPIAPKMSGLGVAVNYAGNVYNKAKELLAHPELGPALRAAMSLTPAGSSQQSFGEDVAAKNYAGAVGTATGVIAQAAAPELLRRTGAVIGKSPIADVLNKPRGTVPAESATPLELKAYADQNDIPLTAAQATEHNLPRNLQTAGERSSIGGTAIRQQIRQAQAAVAQHAGDLMDEMSPNTPDLATAGSTIQKGVQAALDREMTNSRQAYAAIDQQAGGVSVDLKPLKQTAQKILDDSSFVRQAESLDQKRAASILQDMKDLPDSGTFSQAQELRSALLDASRSPELAISSRAQSWIKQLTGATDEQMMSAAQSKPDLETAFRDENDHWQQLQDDFNNPRSPLAQILQEPDPSKVPQKLTQRGQIGGSPYNAQLLDKYEIARGPVKWAIAGDLLQKNFGLYNGGKSLGGYSDSFLQSIFSRQELSHLYKTGAIARSLGLNTNPSGTAAASSAIADSGNIKGAFFKAIPAAATKSAAFNRWMMTSKKAASPVPLSTLLGPAVERRPSDEDSKP